MHVARLSLTDFRNYERRRTRARAGRRTCSSAATARARRTSSRRSATSRPSARIASRATSAADPRPARMPRSSAPGSRTAIASVLRRGAAQPAGRQQAQVNRVAGEDRASCRATRTACCSRRKTSRSCAASPRFAAASLDQLLVQRTPRLAGVMADYERVLKQRNSLLKSARARGLARRQARRRSTSGTSGSSRSAPRSSTQRARARRRARRAARRRPTARSPAPITRPDCDRRSPSDGADPDDEGVADAASGPIRRSDAPAQATDTRHRFTEALAACCGRGSSSAASRWSGRTATTCVLRAQRAAGQGLREPRRIVVVRALAAARLGRAAARATRRPATRCSSSTTCSPSSTGSAAHAWPPRSAATSRCSSRPRCSRTCPSALARPHRAHRGRAASCEDASAIRTDVATPARLRGGAGCTQHFREIFGDDRLAPAARAPQARDARDRRAASRSRPDATRGRSAMRSTDLTTRLGLGRPRWRSTRCSRSWAEIAGEETAQHSEPIAIEDGVLTSPAATRRRGRRSSG